MKTLRAMKRAQRLAGPAARAVRRRAPIAPPLIAALVAGGLAFGCAPQAAPPAPQTAMMPQRITSLSSIAPGNLTPSAKAVVPMPAAVPGASANAAAAQALKEASPAEGSNRLLLENPSTTIHVGSERWPGTETLLNVKAAKFPNFSRALLRDVFVHVQQLEHNEVIARLRLPDDVQPVILTAIMDKSGKLTELIIEQHSGEAYVDKMMIKACKEGLWARNPPPGALSSSGDYRIRIVGAIENFASNGGVWTFKTHLGLALL